MASAHGTKRKKQRGEGIRWKIEEEIYGLGLSTENNGTKDIREHRVMRNCGLEAFLDVERIITKKFSKQKDNRGRSCLTKRKFSRTFHSDVQKVEANM